MHSIYANSTDSAELNQYSSIDYAKYRIRIRRKDNNELVLSGSRVLLETCGRYTIIFFYNSQGDIDFVQLTDIHPNGIHLGWQLVQISVMSVAEVMLAVSGLNFAYSQAPASMKSIIQSAFTMTISMGNLVVIIVAESKFIENQIYEYIVFAGLLGLATSCFIFISCTYVDANFDEENSNNNDKNLNHSLALEQTVGN
jgi:cytochrome b subunit of formate dehydrogenase